MNREGLRGAGGRGLVDTLGKRSPKCKDIQVGNSEGFRGEGVSSQCNQIGGVSRVKEERRLGDGKQSD